MLAQGDGGGSSLSQHGALRHVTSCAHRMRRGWLTDTLQLYFWTVDNVLKRKQEARAAAAAAAAAPAVTWF